MMDLEKELFKWFGYSTFRSGQKEIVAALMENEDVLAVLPTGMGKSICYQLPALLKEGVTIIVSPLLSLMEDQVQQLRSIGIKQVVAINSFMNHLEREEVFRSLSTYKLIYTSPEMLQSDYVLHKLRKLQISLFIVDEAHCISQWGHEFRSDYLRLAQVREKLSNPPCLAITATATPYVQKDICSYLQMSKPKSFIHSVNRPNIAVQVEQYLSTEEKMERLLELTSKLEGPGMVYFSSRLWSEAAARKLQERGIQGVNFYHGGMTNDDRLLIQQQFMQGELSIICCTSAFGMGINKDNIRYVIHFHYPTQMESYVQEIGRAGRDGEKSIAITLFSEEDRGLARLLSKREQLDNEQLVQLLLALSQMEEMDEKAEAELCAKLGCSETAWKNVKVSLEEMNVLKGTMVQRFSIDAVSSMLADSFLKYQINKQKHLSQFETWMHSKTCRRNGVLAYFEEEEKQIQTEDCCDVCGLTLETYYIKEQLHHYNQHDAENWQEELSIRLFGKTGELYE